MMKHLLTLMIGIVIVLILITYMFTFQVRYDEVAVLTTFGKAIEPKRDAQGNIDKDNSGGVKVAPGLYFRLPWPIQSVEKYTTRLQLLDDQLEEQQTADGYSVIVKTYVTWRVDDPYQFFVTLKTYDESQKVLLQLLRDVRGVISRYRFDDMVNIDPSKQKIDEIQKASAEQLQNRLTEHKYGIRIESLGIRKLVLPETVNAKVFERMKSQRQALAQNARSSGTATASTIRSEAKSAQDRILAFAERRAQAIRSQGDEEAAKYYEVFKQNQDFAIFLRQIDSMKKLLGHNTTYILDANKISPLDLFNKEPGSALDTAGVSSDAKAKPGRVNE